MHFFSSTLCLYADSVFKTHCGSVQLTNANRFASVLGEITVKCCYLHLKMIRIGVSERRGAVRDDWERVLATISLKLCLPKCLQQHTSQRRFNFPVPIFCLSFYIRMCGFNCSPVQQCYILIPCPLLDLQADTISPLTVDYQSRATCHTERAVIKVIWVHSEINVTQTSQSLLQCSVEDCPKKIISKRFVLGHIQSLCLTHTFIAE